MKRNGQCQGSARRAVRPFFATVRLCARQTLDGNLLGIYGEYAVRFVQFALLTMIWRALAAQGADLGGMTLRALLTYTLMASVWRQQLNILTPATSALWEGSIIGRFTRPVSILTSLAAETVGRWWVPVFVLYSLPLLLLSPLLGISCLPAGGLCGALALCSLALSASLGFALDLCFAALAMRLKNGCWAATQVREAVYELLSGAAIPFALMPAPVARALSLLPFGSLASAPLTIYVGTADPLPTLALQAAWNATLWPAALYVFRRSRERMVFYGG